MAALIVGGDIITTIKHELSAHGIFDFEHWDGRRPGDLHRIIPKNTELIVVVTNFVNHGLVSKIKRDAKRLRLPVVYSKNSRSFFASVSSV